MASNTLLPHRAVIAIEGAAARTFLHGLVTHDVLTLADDQARWAALLSPQGKVLFDMLVIGRPEGALWLDVEAARAAELMRKLTLYRLRAAVTITLRPDLAVTAHWGAGSHGIADPREPALGHRRYGAPGPDTATPDTATPDTATPDDYRRHRLALGVPEGSEDLPPDRMLWLEANGDLFDGVSFTKGCYVGQENTARMHHRAKVRKRLIPVQVAAGAVAGPVMAGEREAGELRSALDGLGLATLRLELVEQGAALTLEGAPVVPRLAGRFADLLADVPATA